MSRHQNVNLNQEKTVSKTATARKPAAIKAAALISIQIPPIGSVWPGQGGIYAGIGRAEDGTMQHVIVGPESPKTMPWDDAKKWATGIKVDGQKDFTLPTRREQRLAWANVPELFETVWYWSGEPSAGDASYAWFQDFYNGTQNDTHKDIHLRARAVRRFSIR